MNIGILNSKNKDEIIARAVKTLRDGRLLIYPTETCYGIGADSCNPEAIDKLLEYKSKRGGKPLSVAVCDRKMAEEYVFINDIADNIYQSLLPGPLTIISKSKGVVASKVESSLGTLGIRIPDYSLIREIIKIFGKPVTSTSANASYKKTPYTIEDIFSNISRKQKNLLGYVIDAGRLEKNPPSTVIDTTLGHRSVLRQGAIKLGNTKFLDSKSPEDTMRIGKDIIKEYKKFIGEKSIIFALQGELGAGKTIMSKGVAEFLGISENVKSPTFIIQNVYKLKRTELIHIDTWRLEKGGELEEFGFFEEVVKGKIFIIEWADKILPILEKVKDSAIIKWIYIEKGDGNWDRSIRVSDFNS